METRKQVFIGEPQQPKYEGEGKKKETLSHPEKTEHKPSREKEEGGEHRITRTLRPLGITSIRNVDVTNRQYLSPGVHMYIKNREGVYQDIDVSHFLNNADLKLTFTLPIDADPDDLAFYHQKSACPVVNPLLHCQCTVRVGLLEAAGEPQKAHELVQARTGKTYLVELPLIRGLSFEPFQTLHYTIRVAGLRMPEQTDMTWRIHLKVCQAEDLIEVVSVSDSPFDVNFLQDNIHTFSDRFNDMVVSPIKRRGWLNWIKKSGRQEQHPTPSSDAPPKGEQYEQPVSGSEKSGESSSLRV